jgi:hypothetical protein
MTFGTEVPDISGTENDLTIRPNNAESLGLRTATPAATASFGDSALDQLLGLADTAISNKVKFPVKFRPGGFVLEFDAVISEPDIKRYRAAAQGKRKKAEDADMSVGNAMAIFEKNIAIYQEIDGQLKKILDADGDDLIVNSPTFVNAFGKGSASHVAVRKFLGDAETNTIGAAVLKAAGWGEDLEPLDPTDA